MAGKHSSIKFEIVEWTELTASSKSFVFVKECQSISKIPIIAHNMFDP